MGTVNDGRNATNRLAITHGDEGVNLSVLLTKDRLWADQINDATWKRRREARIR
jgi:hypothetical protein